MTKPRIAVFSGPTATIGNTPDLVTSNKARARFDLPLMTAPSGEPVPYDTLRPQRLAAPVRVFVEAFTAHPLEKDAEDLYSPPDGWLDAHGQLHEAEPPGGAVPVFIVELRPEDGLYLLPYMARRTDGSAWEAAGTSMLAPADQCRQTFYPDASRIYEEINRFAIDDHGRPVALSSIAEFDFYRAAPSAGYTKGIDASRRTDAGVGDIEPELLGIDFFPYYPEHLWREPSRAVLARATNMVQSVLATGDYVGAQWLEGSPTIEETMYWLGLVIDTPHPLVGHCAAQGPHQALNGDGDRNIVAGVKFITSRVAIDERGRNRLGAVLLADEVVYAAREVVKADARPGGYSVAGGHGGVVADMGGDGPPQLTYVPARLHTWCSAVRQSVLPAVVPGVTGSLRTGVRSVDVETKNRDGGLCPSSIPAVTITTYVRYIDYASGPGDAPDVDGEVEILARIAANLEISPLAGFVLEGMSPYAVADPAKNAALSVAVFAGMPVVGVGRGNPGGMATRSNPIFIAGNNLTPTKARILLMAAMLKLGALPPAADPFHPASSDIAATIEAVAGYQHIFDTH